MCVYLSKNRYPQGVYNKLRPRKLNPCKILHKFGENAHAMEMPKSWKIHDAFNIYHWQPYCGEYESENLRSSSFSAEGNDVMAPSSSSIHNM